VGNSRGTCKLARTPHVNKKKWIFNRIERKERKRERERDTTNQLLEKVGKTKEVESGVIQINN